MTVVAARCVYRCGMLLLIAAANAGCFQAQQQLWQQAALALSLSAKQQAGKASSSTALPPWRPTGIATCAAAAAAARQSSRPGSAVARAATVPAAVVAKGLSLKAVLCSESWLGPEKPAYQGWQGTGFLLQLLEVLCSKLRCKLVMQVMRVLGCS